MHHDTTILNLAGTWRLTSPGFELPIAIPGDVHTALLEAGLIADPYWGERENEVQWVSATDWVVERMFDCGPLLDAPSIVVEALCLDTLVEIEINGTLIGRVANMHRRHRLEVRPHLVRGENRIRLTFRSAEVEAARRAAGLPYPIPGSWNCRKPHFNLLRKAQCHPGWDWGICLVPAGVYDALQLRATRTARLDQVTTLQDHHPGWCTVTVVVEAWSPDGGCSELIVDLGGQRVQRVIDLSPGASHHEVALVIEHPRLWWPAGAGEQPLYPLEVTLDGHVVRKRIGLRRLEVVVEPDSIGTAMRVRCNGRDLFVKGANWIPADAIPSRQTTTVWRGLLESARAAHMNMIRVWGGGQYEREEFYDLCDELGLMIWHDHMFACALYPSTPEFLAEVREEVSYQTTRLRDHACIALWCGDNECIGALSWYEDPKRNRDRYLIDWDRLNRERTAAGNEADPTRLFWPSSPCAGPGDFSDTWLDDRHGDMHYWEVWHKGRDLEAYHAVTPRFCSEFGYQSFPSMETVQTFCPPEEMNITSAVMEHHQRHPDGNRLIVEMMSRYFRMPNGFASFLYLSQVLQSVAVRMAVEHWRRLRPICMGTLYWQLNDNWPVASWSSIEYGGRWKQLHHHARRFYAPVAVSGLVRGGVVEIWAVNDHDHPVEGQVWMEVWSYAGSRLEGHLLEAHLPADTSICLGIFSLESLAQGQQVRERFLHLVPVGLEGATEESVHFARWKSCRLGPARVTARCEEGGVVLETDVPAFFVTVATPGVQGEFDDNSLTLLPGRPRRIAHPGTPASVEVRHLQEACS